MKKQLKNKIVQSFEAETPDVKKRVIDRCISERQIEEEVSYRPKRSRLFTLSAFALAFVIVFSIGAFFGNFYNASYQASADSYVYLDVNPSIELSLNKDGKVIDCIAGNSDAEVVLDGINLKNVEVYTALNTIVGSMYIHGYLQDGEATNSILISINSKSDKTQFLQTMVDDVKNIFETANLNCSVIAQQLNKDEIRDNDAKHKQISIGKMELINKIIAEIEGYSEEDVESLSQMSIKELSFIYFSNDVKIPNGKKEDIKFGEINDFLDKNTACEIVLENLNLNREDVEFIDALLVKNRFGENSKLIYRVKVKLKNDFRDYFYLVDVETREFLPA